MFESDPIILVEIDLWDGNRIITFRFGSESFFVSSVVSTFSEFYMFDNDGVTIISDNQSSELILAEN
jgi:hypothetical protein